MPIFSVTLKIFAMTEENIINIEMQTLGEETISLRFHKIYFLFYFGRLFLASNPCKSNHFSQNIWNGYTKKHLNPVYQVATLVGDISLRASFSQMLTNSPSAHQLKGQPLWVPGVPNTGGCSAWREGYSDIC